MASPAIPGEAASGGPGLSIRLASLCYGGLAQARFMRSVLALAAACRRRGVSLELELGGGEALASRGRAAMLAKFLSGAAGCLVFAEPDCAFSPDEVFTLIESGAPVIASSDDPDADRPRLLLIRRDAAERMTAAYGELQAGLADLRAADGVRAPMLFESMIDPAMGRYLDDVAAFLRRWEALER